MTPEANTIKMSQVDLAFLENLRNKYCENEIYVSIYMSKNILLYLLIIRGFFRIFQSYISDVLIAINPYKKNPDLYTADVIIKYQGVLNIGILPAHIFGIGKYLDW